MSVWLGSSQSGPRPLHFWTLAIRTSVADGGIDRNELSALLVLSADSLGVVSMGFEVSG